MTGIGLIFLILALIAIFGGIYFAVWCFCAVQRNHQGGHHILEGDEEHQHKKLYSKIDIQTEETDECLISDECDDTTVAMEAVSLNGALLPAEILEKVFCLLPPRDLKSVVRVCKWWREIGEVPRLWTWACFKVDCRVYSAQTLQEMLASRRLQSVKRMKVRSAFGVMLRNEVAIFDVLLPAVTEFPGLLESLDLGGPRNDGHFINLSHVDDNNLIPQTVTKLFEVTFSEFSLLSTQQIKAIFAALLDHSSMLKRLNMYHVDLSFVDEQIIARVINKLEEVDLTGAKMTCQQVTALFTIMMENSNLKKLSFDIGGRDWRTRLVHNTGGQTPINGVNPELLAKALTHLEDVKLPTGLNLKQAKAIFATLNTSQGRLKRLDISGRSIYNHNDLSSVDPVLLANVVNKMEFVDISYTNLTVSQTYAILTQSIKDTSLKKLLIVANERRKFRRQTKRMEKLHARALQVIPITDLWRTWHCKYIDS